MRLALFAAFRRRLGRGPLGAGEALWWERAYGAGSLAVAVLTATLTLRAFAGSDFADATLSMSLSLATCGGQSSPRVASRPWVPILTGTVLLLSLTSACLLHGHPTLALAAGMLVLYAASHVEACHNGSEIVRGRILAERVGRFMAQHDALTGLLNRSDFADRLREACARARGGAGCAVLYLDLDRFKAVNDTYGHAAGDALLRQVAERLRGTMRVPLALARLDGDEFAVLTAGADPSETAALARRIVEALGRPYDLPHGRACIGVSAWIALAPAHGTEPDALLSVADTALYEAKNAGRGTWRLAPAGLARAA